MTQQRQHVKDEKPRSYPESGKVAGNCQGPFSPRLNLHCSIFPSTLVTVHAVRCSCTFKGPARSAHILFFTDPIKCLPIKAPPPSATRFSLNWDYLTTHTTHNYITTSVH